MVHAVQRWTFGKPIRSLPHTLLIHVPLTPRLAALELIAALEQDTLLYAMLMVVTSTLTARVTPLSMVQVLP